VPPLVLYGDRNGPVPYERGQKVFAAARASKGFNAMSSGMHYDTYLVGGNAYFARLRALPKRCFQPIRRTTACLHHNHKQIRDGI
jgi:hypothetical protein